MLFWRLVTRLRPTRRAAAENYDSGRVRPPLAPLVERWTHELLPVIPGRCVIPPALRAFFLAGLASRATRPLLAVVSGEREAEEMAEDLEMFHAQVQLLPAWETLPFEHVSPNIGTMAQRTMAYDALARGTAGLVVVASVRAAIQRLSPSLPDPILIGLGDVFEFDSVVDGLVERGYCRTHRVESRGEIAVRGGIVDVAPAQGGKPIRIEFLGDHVDDLRRFSVRTQRAIESVSSAVFYPAREFRLGDEVRERADYLRQSHPWASGVWDRITAGVTFQGMESWMPWLTPAVSLVDQALADVVMFDCARAVARARDLFNEETDLALTLAPTWGVGVPETEDYPRLYLPLTLESGRILEVFPQPVGPGDESLRLRSLDAVAGNPTSVVEALRQCQEQGITVVVAMDGIAAATRSARLFSDSGMALAVVNELDSVRPAVLATGIRKGFIVPKMGVGVVGEQEVAGRRRGHRRTRTRARGMTEDAYRDLAPGDYVVHHHHGIGRFEGLVHREMAGVERDYLLVAYHGEDRLYIPTDQLVAVRRYAGGEAPRLSRLGGADWETTRSKVRQAVKVIAEEVVDLHRRRAATVGHSFDPDTPWQAELESSFSFEETPDQLRAIEDMKADMEAPKPMDRLIFGDVGFGKTEVALRGVFKAVQGAKQAAVLVPTTLLAQQHHSTFQDRLASYPIRVEMLSRFLTPRQQKAVIEGLALGTVDVVVATHRLLSDDIVFKDLGLLVIDEEQRFGVSAKDKLRRLCASIDVLTLTATPIPRTLEMALTGIREVSKIRTPPEDRHPILTYVGPYEEQTVAAAIRRELLREGQVFVVHNRIQSIDYAVARLRELVPDARYAVVHGRMSESQLEQAMYSFWNCDYDVLVATTIIESGLDLPQVNTLIVERSDLLGLAQLYQLRGRVGRSSQRAYAYLFHPPEADLSEDAYRRLEAIGEYSDLGSGFELAIRDLEIRGAGSILGETQVGHIAAVGFDLYTELVANAVDELRGHDRGQMAEAPTEIRIDIPVDARLPDDYIPSSSQRLEAYRRLAAALTEEEIVDIEEEWRDRFGEPVDEARTLIDIARLRMEAVRAGLNEVVKLRNEVRLSPVALTASGEVRLARLCEGALVRGEQVFIALSGDNLVAELISFIRTMWPPVEN